MYAAQLPKHCKAAGHSFRDLSPHRCVRVKVDSEVTDSVHWSDVVATNSDHDTRKLVPTQIDADQRTSVLEALRCSSVQKHPHLEAYHTGLAVSFQLSMKSITPVASFCYIYQGRSQRGYMGPCPPLS